MKVWIDQISAGDILVPGEHAAPFNLLDDGLAHVKGVTQVKNDPVRSGGMTAVPSDLEVAVAEVSEERPGECIFIEKGLRSGCQPDEPKS